MIKKNTIRINNCNNCNVIIIKTFNKKQSYY